MTKKKLALDVVNPKAAGIDVGSTVTVQVDSGAERSLLVTGVSRDVGLAPGWMEHVVYGFVTPATLVALGVPATFNELRIVVRDRTLDRDAVRRIAFEIKFIVIIDAHVLVFARNPVPPNT